MKKYAALISLSLMILATCAFGMAPSLVLPGVKIQSNQPLTPSIDIADYVFDWDSGSTFTATGPENSGLITVTMDATGTISITETGQAIGYTEIRTFDVDDGASATDQEGLLIEVIAGAGHLDPAPIYGADFDNDDEEWRGIDEFDSSTYAYDASAGSYKVSVVGDLGDEYYSLLQAPEVDMAGAGINIENGKVYAISCLLTGSDVATDMPQVRVLAAGNRIEGSYETIVFPRKDGISPGPDGMTYTAQFTPTLDPASPTDSLLYRVDLIYFPGAGSGAHPVGARTLHVDASTVSLVGSLGATTTYSEVASYDFEASDEGWTTASTTMRNRAAGTASFSHGSGKYTITTTATTLPAPLGQGIVGMLQSPYVASATMQGGKNYLIEAQMSSSEASASTMPRVRVLMGNSNIDISSETYMFEAKPTVPTSAGNTTYYVIGSPVTTPAGDGTFVRVDLLHAGVMNAGNCAGTRSLSVDKVAIYEM